MGAAMDIEKALEKLRAEIKDLEAEISERQLRLEELRQEAKVFERWIRRHEARDTALIVEDWSDLSRAGAVEKALAEARRPLSPSAISAVLANKGRSGDPPHYVSAALAYLQGAGRARRTGQSRWVVEPSGSPREPGAPRSAE
jgi:septal ring factor EnvC (AmiA/AmiB activator)